MQLKIIAAIFFAMVGVVFSMQNNIPVTVNFLLWRFDSSLALVLMAALALGAIIVALLTTLATIRRRWQLIRQKRRIEELERICGALDGASPAVPHPQPGVGKLLENGRTSFSQDASPEERGR